MLKLNASYSKKVPAEGNFTSQSYHVSLEVELPDGMNREELERKIGETFDLARQSVEAELTGIKPEKTVAAEEPTASAKQVSYLNTLAKQKGIDIVTLLRRYGLNNAYHLTRKQCTVLIDELKGAA